MTTDRHDAARRLGVLIDDPRIVEAAFGDTPLGDLLPDDCYTSGGCWVMAAALAALLERPVVALVDDPAEPPLHALVDAGGGLFIDGLGGWSETELRGYWGEITDRGEGAAFRLIPQSTAAVAKTVAADPNGGVVRVERLKREIVRRVPDALLARLR
jgi:hypothetical protein